MKSGTERVLSELDLEVRYKLLQLKVLVWNRIKCLFGKHGEAAYCGEIKIIDIDRERHRIEYGNVKRCPNCRKVMGVDFLHE